MIGRIFCWLARREPLYTAEMAAASGVIHRKWGAVIDAMTMRERANPEIVDISRRSRIARGAGVKTLEVRQVVVGYMLLRDY